VSNFLFVVAVALARCDVGSSYSTCTRHTRMRGKCACGSVVAGGLNG
jgi:hypothetical protein